MTAFLWSIGVRDANITDVSALTSVPIGSLAVERFENILTPDQYARFMAAAERSRDALAGRVIWNVNSTARGGGVAELLVSLLAYAHAAGVDTRWEVISGNAAFFDIVKRLHNNLHSDPGDGGPLGQAERETYESTLAPNLDELIDRVRPDDVVIVHDPQPAGLIPELKRARNVPVIWRCHVGVDVPSDLTRRAWRFLSPYVDHADAIVFSRRAQVWEGLDPGKVEVIAPVIDVFSTKNQDLDDATVDAILSVAGFSQRDCSSAATFRRVDGTEATVKLPAEIIESQPLHGDEPFVLQVSRWDRLKDPEGVISGFAEYVAPHTDAHLVYAGPAVTAVADDPEGQAVLDDVRKLFDRLPAHAQARLHLACLPMNDLEENAAIVNALQRRAVVVVQKSLAEGFGLTVAEALWKARPVVASRVGGIQDQIVDGVGGLLLDDPNDLGGFGAAVVGLLHDPERAHSYGLRGQARVRDEFLSARSLMQYLDLIERLLY